MKINKHIYCHLDVRRDLELSVYKISPDVEMTCVDMVDQVVLVDIIQLS